MLVATELAVPLSIEAALDEVDYGVWTGKSFHELAQDSHWRRWNEAMQTTLIGRQRTDGDMAGSWDPECIWGGYGGRIYSTSLSTLCLEVYYRYLPIYRVATAPGGSQPNSVIVDSQ